MKVKPKHIGSLVQVRAIVHDDDRVMGIADTSEWTLYIGWDHGYIDQKGVRHLVDLEPSYGVIVDTGYNARTRISFHYAKVLLSEQRDDEGNFLAPGGMWWISEEDLILVDAVDEQG